MDGTGPLLTHVTPTAAGVSAAGVASTTVAPVAPVASTAGAGLGAGLGAGNGICLAAKTTAVGKLAIIGGALGGGVITGFILAASAAVGLGYVGYRTVRALGGTASPERA